ncbi:MAG TPA: phosphatidylserine decarboxylase [Gammaproteobacteria bacterium]|nr:phosphatidylserine decarboxylase [Gammaproteobacteria bacterium]
MFTDYLKALPQYLLPHHPLSRVVGRLVRCRIPVIKNLLINAFTRLYRIEMDLAENPDPYSYPDFNSFFTRALRPEARPLATAAEAIISPVDGQISQAGTCHDGRILQAKGRSYTLTQLLGDSGLAARFAGGSFATIYLSPRDYHRIHMPLAGRLLEMVHVPGRLFSVSPATTRVIPGLFARNERVICLFDSDAGPMALVLVGAIFVASIETCWAGVVTPPSGRTIRRRNYRDDPAAPSLERGAEMGRFNMGSTVILLFGPDRIAWQHDCREGATVRMGQQIGALSHKIAFTDKSGG